MEKQFVENSLSTTLVQDIINQGDVTIDNMVAQQESSKKAITAQTDLEIQRLNTTATQKESVLEEKKNACVVVLNQTTSNKNAELINTFNSKNRELISTGESKKQEIISASSIQKQDIITAGEDKVDRIMSLFSESNTQLVATGESKKQEILDLYGEKVVAIDSYGDDKILEVKNQTDAQVKRVRDQGNTEVQRVIDAGVTGKVSKSGDTMSGVLTVPAVQGIRTSAYTNPSTNEKTRCALSAESGYSMLWRISDSQDKADEFIGLQPSSVSSIPIVRIATGGGKYNYRDYKLYHEGFKPTKNDVGLGNVNDWGATTSVNSTSTTTYATASAVKQAYDRGSLGVTNAETALTTANSKVSKSGDTMSGILNSSSPSMMKSTITNMHVHSNNSLIGFLNGDESWVFNVNNSGDTIAGGNITAYSDIKLKKDFEVISNALEKINSISGYTYTRKDSGERQAGVIAQEIQKVLPEVVKENKDENGEITLSVAYGNMVALLIEGVKEQQKKIDYLEERLSDLEKLVVV